MHKRQSARLIPLALLLTSAMLTLASCATTTGLSGPTDADWSKVSTIVTCQSIKPIHWSSHDTDQTIKEAKAHNAALLAVCPSLRP